MKYFMSDLGVAIEMGRDLEFEASSLRKDRSSEVGVYTRHKLLISFNLPRDHS